MISAKTPFLGLSPHSGYDARKKIYIGLGEPYHSFQPEFSDLVNLLCLEMGIT
jgi:hypothetical protein